MQKEQEMTTFTIDVDMRKLATRVMETISALQDYLAKICNILICQGSCKFYPEFLWSRSAVTLWWRDYFPVVVAGRMPGIEIPVSEESEHGKLSSQLRFNLSKPKYRFQFDCKIFYKIKMLALSKPWEDSMELVSSLSLFLNLFFEKCQYLPVWLVKLHQIALSIDIFNFDLEIFLYN